MKPRRLLIPLTLALTLLALLVVAIQPKPAKLSAPRFALPELEGNALVSSADFAGQPWVINVWASWCVSCRAEIPFLLALRETGTVVVGLNYKDDPAQASAWLNEFGDPFTVLAVDANGTTADGFGVATVPETIVISANGNIVFRHMGPIDDQGDLDTMLTVLEDAS